MYADDLVLFCPSAKGLQKLINICDKYGLEYDIIYNSTKSAIMIFSCNMLKNHIVSNFYLNGNIIPVCSKYKYLGHIIQNTLKDDIDIERQRKKLYAQGNSIFRKFHMCSESTKILLFKMFCCSFYTSHLWFNYTKKTMTSFNVAFNNIFRLLCKESRRCSASLMFVTRNVHTCNSLIRCLVVSFIKRISNSNNILLTNIMRSDCKYQSVIWKHWFKLLYVHNSIFLWKDGLWILLPPIRKTGYFFIFYFTD